MQQIKCNNYQELLEFLEYNEEYTIEPFIKDAKQVTININSSKLEMLELEGHYFNLYCTVYNKKDLNGLEELMCHQIGGSVIKKYNNDHFHNIIRVKLNEQNFYKQKEMHKNIVLKNINEKYYENNLMWDWITVLS